LNGTYDWMCSQEYLDAVLVKDEGRFLVKVLVILGGTVLVFICLVVCFYCYKKVDEEEKAQFEPMIAEMESMST